MDPVKWEDIQGIAAYECRWFYEWRKRIKEVADLPVLDADFFYYYDTQPDPWVNWRPKGTFFITASCN